MQVVDPSVGLPEDDPLRVTVRQVPEGGRIKREDMLGQSLIRKWDAGEDQLQLVNQLRRRAVEVWLAIIDCNVEIETKGGKTTRLKGEVDGASFDDFMKLWERFDPEWADRIHLCCLVANPTWAGDSLSPDDLLMAYPFIEQIETEGEENGEAG